MTDRKPDAAGWLPQAYARHVVLGVLRRGSEILLTGMPPDDTGPQDIVWRVPGGGQDFQESMEAALRREFLEELNVEISVGKMFGTWDHIYDFRNLPGHDVYSAFEVTTADDGFLSREDIEIHEPDGRYFPCRWASLEEIREGRLLFMPQELLTVL